MSIRQILREAARDLWRCMPALLAFDLVFKVVAAVALLPLAGWLLAWTVRRSGDVAVANVDIARVLLTPVGLLMTFLTGVLLLTIAQLEAAGLMFIGERAMRDRRASYVAALRFLRRSAVRVFELALCATGMLAISVAPFVLGMLLVVELTVTAHDINYYLEARPPELWIAVCLVGALGLGAAWLSLQVVTSIIFALPNILFRGGSVRAGLREARNLARGRIRLVAGTVLSGLFLWVALAVGLNLLVHVTGGALIQMSGDRIGILLVTLGGISVVGLVANLTLSFLGLSLLCLAVVHLFRVVCVESGFGAARHDAPGEPLGDHPRWELPQKAPLLAAGGVLVAMTVVVVGLLEAIELDTRLEVAAHRGSSKAAPENTLAAVRQAIADGATAVEIDVQRTADGIIVVAHDADLMRVAGVPLVVHRSGYAQLLEADVGASFDPVFAGERIPTLDQVIDEVTGRARLIVEIKAYQDDAQRLVADVVRIFNARHLHERAVIMSLSRADVREVRRLDPAIRIGLVTSKTLGDATLLDVDFLAVSKGQATELLIGAAHAQGQQVYVWTVDDPGDMTLMIERGADCLITNVPATVVELLAGREQLSTIERLLLRFRSLYAR